MNIKMILCLFFVLGCTKQPTGPSPEDLIRQEKENSAQAAKDAEEKEKYRLATLEREKKKREEKLQQMQLEFQTFEVRNKDYKKFAQINQLSGGMELPEAKTFKEFIKKLNRQIKTKGLPFYNLNFSKKDVKDTVIIPDEKYYDNPLGEIKSIAILNPKGVTKSPIVINNSKGIGEGPCSYDGSVFISDLLVKSIKNGSVLVSLADGKKDVWLTPSFFESVRIYKKNQKKVFEEIVLPNEDAFVIHNDTKNAVVYVMFTRIAGKYKDYPDYPGVKSERAYLVLKMSSTTFEFIDDPEIYKNASDYRGRTPFTEDKGHYRQNENYEFRFSLDVCT
jgi:hypothetical protein